MINVPTEKKAPVHSSLARIVYRMIGAKTLESAARVENAEQRGTNRNIYCSKSWKAHGALGKCPGIQNGIHSLQVLHSKRKAGETMLS